MILTLLLPQIQSIIQNQLIEIKRRFVGLGNVAKGQSSKICGGKYNLVLTSESIEKSRLQRNKKLLNANDLLIMTVTRSQIKKGRSILE